MWCRVTSGRGSGQHVADPPTFQMPSVSVSVVQRVLRPLALSLGVSQWGLVCKWLLAVLLVRRNEARNDFCHHLGDSTLIANMNTGLPQSTVSLDNRDLTRTAGHCVCYYHLCLHLKDVAN